MRGAEIDMSLSRNQAAFCTRILGQSNMAVSGEQEKSPAPEIFAQSLLATDIVGGKEA